MAEKTTGVARIVLGPDHPKLDAVELTTGAVALAFQSGADSYGTESSD